MTRSCILGSICALLLFGTVHVRAATSTVLLPGLNCYGGPEELRGKLVFLTANARLTASKTSASIFQYDLRRKALRKITDSPPGYLIPSRTGEFLCVLPPDNASPDARRPFLYADSLKQSRTVQLERPPDQTVLIAHHAFFLIDGERYLADFDFDTQKTTFVGDHDPSAWGRGYVSQLSQNLDALGTVGVLHFKYYHREGLTEGPRYESGFYDLDINSGKITWSPQQVDPSLYFRANNGQYVYFKGTGSPLHGFTLAMSPWDGDKLALRHDPQGKVTRLLHDFPRPLISRGCYTLDCMSPEGTYALVSYRALGRGRTFYVVNVKTGKTDLLIKDRGTLGEPFEENPLWWLP